jgi:hypothetical protein
MVKTENLHAGDCIRTHSGQYVNVFNPDPDTILIEDIAHSLAHQCRWGGHISRFYSVAQHSLYCSYWIMDPKLKLAALMHDASEAYLLDIPRPIKKKLYDYTHIEHGLMYVIAEKFGFKWPMDKAVKEVDEEMLHLEWKYLVLNDDKTICTFPHQQTVIQFKQMFYEYQNL